MNSLKIIIAFSLIIILAVSTVSLLNFNHNKNVIKEYEGLSEDEFLKKACADKKYYQLT